MLDLIAPLRPAQPAAQRSARSYLGPERRSADAGLWSLIAAAIEEVDYGMVLLDDELHAFHLNAAARQTLSGAELLLLRGRALGARRARDENALYAALKDALGKGRRKLLNLGDEGARQMCVSVVPLDLPGAQGRRSVLVMLEKRKVCGELAVESFARNHQLSYGETRVLQALCDGMRPTQAARSHGVALSTIRTQISSIRAKTGAASIPDLLGRIASLPPLMSVLRAHCVGPSLAGDDAVGRAA
jgi:DNA-binding CsgD family transcriptional regulator